MGVTVLAAAGTACGTDAASEAAQRAQDACIGLLEPVSAGRPLTSAVVEKARADAEAAARIDPDRWERLRADVSRAGIDLDSPARGPLLDALVEECERVNEVVRTQGREPAA